MKSSRITLPAAVAGAVVAGTVLMAGPAVAASKVPYQDPSATGYIGLCNKSGQQVTHGTLSARPFIWRAVSSVAAQAPYDDSGRTATLYVFQPRKGLPPGDWSGSMLTAAARYTNVAHPMAASTNGDLPLSNFTSDFHPQWDGLLQLRMYLGAPGAQPESISYPATDIQISGNTWRVVDGGPVSCTSGRAQSIESILLPKSDTDPQRHHAKTHHAGSSSPGTGKAAATHHAGARAHDGTAASSPVAAEQPETSTAADSGGDPAGKIAIGLAAVAIAGAIFFFVRRRNQHSDPAQSGRQRH